MINKIIEKWMQKTIDDGSWKNNNDLHIDNISTKYKKPEKWLRGGLICLEQAISIRNSLYKSFIIELFIELKADTKPIGINFETLDELNKEIAWSPPSLYLFDLKYEKWIDNMKKAKEINIIDYKNDSIKCIYNEILKNDPEYYRHVSFVSIPE